MSAYAVPARMKREIVRHCYEAGTAGIFGTTRVFYETVTVP